MTDLAERLRKRGKTMNGAAPVGAGDGNTYTLGYYDQFAAADDIAAADELDRLRECLRKDPNTVLIAHENGEDERLAQLVHAQDTELDRLRTQLAEAERRGIERAAEAARKYGDIRIASAIMNLIGPHEHIALKVEG